MTVDVGIGDDNVYEADEFFAVRLDVGDASPNVILGEVRTSLCRIIDNDGKWRYVLTKFTLLQMV